MKKVLMLLGVVALLGACSGNSNKSTSAVEDKTEVFSVDSFLVVAGDFVGKEVVVKGTVDHVCKHGGKRIRIFSTCPSKSLNAEASDEMGTFASEVEGNEVCMTGVVAEIKMDMAYVQEYEQKMQNAAVTPSEEPQMEHKPGADHHASVAKIEQWKKDIEASGKGYISDYYLQVSSYTLCNAAADSCCHQANDTLQKVHGCCSGAEKACGEQETAPCQN